MIGLDGNVVNKKNEDDPYGVAIAKKISTPCFRVPPEGKSASRTANESPNNLEKMTKGSAGSGNFKFSKPLTGPGDTLFDPEDLLQDEDEEEDMRRLDAKTSQKASRKQLPENSLISRKTEGVKPKLGAGGTEGNPCNLLCKP